MRTAGKENGIIKTNIRAFKWISGVSKWYFPVMALGSLFGNLSPFVNIYMSARIVDEIAGDRNTDTLISLVVATLIINLVITVVSTLLSRLNKHNERQFSFGEHKAYLNKFLGTDYERLESGELMGEHWHIYQSSRINGFGINAMRNSSKMLTDNIINIILSVSLMSSLVVYIASNPGRIKGMFLIILLFAFITAFIFLSFRNSKSLARLGEKISLEGKKQNIISDFFNGDSIYQTGKDYRIYDMAHIIDDYKQKKLDILQKNNREYWYGYRNTQIPEIILSSGLNLIIYIFVSVNALSGAFGIGSVIMYVGFISRFVSAVKAMASNIAMFKMNLPFLTNFLNYFQVNKTAHHGRLTTEKRSDNEYEIEFRNVSFKYPGGDTWALRNLNLKFRVGERMAVVGMNGSGKTTMIKLLCRLYDPTEGEITLNGIDIKNYLYDEYLQLFSVVFQDFQLFSFPLGQNIAASEEVDEDRAIFCLNKAGIGSRLESMPRGLLTPLYRDFEKDGVEISGGEAQKIALARALYKNAPFIVLDEPTAALDPIAEFEIYSKFNTIVGDKTAIYISHRLSSCRFCDDIAVFHEGRLIQRGSHEALIADENGKYHELWTAQAQYYTDVK